jgi:hypothetical protein
VNYVEWLRVRGVLKWTTIVLVCGVALLLLGRFAFWNVGPHATGFSPIEIGNESLRAFERSSRETQTTLPDGTRRTVFSNARKGIRLTIDDRGYWGSRVDVFEKTPPAGTHPEHIDFGDIHVVRTNVPGGSLLQIDEGGAKPEDLNYYFALGALVALIVATVLGAPFARENEGHLEIALTKPISRERFALGAIGADLAGIAAAWVMTVALLFAGHVFFEAPSYTYGPSDTTVLVSGLLAACGWYAMLTAATASMKRAYGIVLGIAWPIHGVVSVLGSSNLGDKPPELILHTIARAIGWIDPLTYLNFGPNFIVMQGPGAHPAASAALPDGLATAAVLALVYGALAVVQWRRVEA